VLGTDVPPELAGVPGYPSPEGAVAALVRAVSYAQWRAEPTGSVPELARRATRARTLLAGHTGPLDKARATELLGCYGIDVHPSVTAPAGVAVVVGSLEHPRYGPLVSFGVAGPATDLLGDRAHHILPLTDADAARLVRSVRAAPLLFGYRGAETVDVAALELLLMRVARLADDVPEVVSLTLEPVIVAKSSVAVLAAEIIVGRSLPRADAGPRKLWAPAPKHMPDHVSGNRPGHLPDHVLDGTWSTPAAGGAQAPGEARGGARP
jgi:acyl-CoA synthetase (NDP forming)